MSEQLLDDPQVRAALEQVRRERVAQGVRADGRRQPGVAAAARWTIAPGLLARQPAAPVAEEQRAAPDRLDVMAARGAPARAPSIQVASASSASSPTGTSRSLSPLPMTRTNAPSTERSSRSRPSASLTRRPGGVEQLQQRRVARTGRRGRVEQPGAPPRPSSVSGRRRPWRGRSRCAATSTRDQALAVGEPVEALERGRATTQAGRREAVRPSGPPRGPRRQVRDGDVGRPVPSGPGASPRSRRDRSDTPGSWPAPAHARPTGRPGSRRWPGAGRRARRQPSDRGYRPARRATPRHGPAARGPRRASRHRRGRRRASRRARRSGPRGPAARPRSRSDRRARAWRSGSARRRARRSAAGGSRTGPGGDGRGPTGCARSGRRCGRRSRCRPRRRRASAWRPPRPGRA